MVTVAQEQENVRLLGNMAQSDRYNPDDVSKGGFSKEFTGKFIKHYSYDRFDEVYLENFENGAVVHKIGGPDLWFDKSRRQIAFELAKLMGQRVGALNRMFGE